MAAQMARAPVNTRTVGGLSKLFTRLNHSQSMTQVALKAFAQMKKPSIGDAVTIL
jgi:hypothetical protein